MQQLHRRGTCKHIVVHLTQQVCAKKHKYGAYLLPLLFKIMMHHPVHKRIGRIKRRQYTVVQALQIWSQGMLDRLERGHYF